MPRKQDAVFLCGSDLSAADDEDPTIPNFLPVPLPLDGEATTTTTYPFSIG